MSERVRVAVLFGGRSDEHAVSCATAAGVLAAIDRSRYEVIPVGITRSGQWVIAEDNAQAWAITNEKIPEVTEEAGPRVMVPMGEAGQELVQLDDSCGQHSALKAPDVVFPLLHGPFGEDGTIQGMLELAGLPYVGSGVLASAVGMDKHYMKVVFASAGLPIGDYAVITDAQWQLDPQAAMARAEDLAWPVFVKPARAGSSIGITKVDDPHGLAEAIEIARRHDPKVVIESGIAGREVECAVLQGRDGAPTRATLPGEIAVAAKDHGFYDYEAKYFDADSVTLNWPADLPEKASNEVRRLAIEAFDALGCEALARVDFFYTEAGEVILNEANTMPGFTPFSMYPMMWQRSGMDYQELITELIELARSRPVGLR